MKFIYLIALLVFPLFCSGKTGDNWSEGKIIFSDNLTVKGEVKYDQKHEIIQIKKDGMIKAYSSHHVDYFEFLDEKSQTIKKFSAKDKATNSFKRKIFYEIVLEGDFTLLRKDLAGTMPAWITDSFVDDNNEYIYYINQNNTVVKLTDFEKQVLPILADQKIAVEEFINKNNFNFSSPTSQILIINYYNHLKKGSPSFSKL